MIGVGALWARATMPVRRPFLQIELTEVRCELHEVETDVLENLMDSEEIKQALKLRDRLAKRDKEISKALGILDYYAQMIADTEPTTNTEHKMS